MSTAPDGGRFAVLPGDGFHADGSFDPRTTCDGAGDHSPPAREVVAAAKDGAIGTSSFTATYRRTG